MSLRKNEVGIRWKANAIIRGGLTDVVISYSYQSHGVKLAVRSQQKLKEYIQGWVGYYHLADMRRLCLETDKWLRRRIRMCIWKAWKKPKTKVMNLIKCGIAKWQAYQWGNTRLAYWHIAHSPILLTAISNDRLRRQGYMCLMDSYLEWNPK